MYIRYIGFFVIPWLKIIDIDIKFWLSNLVMQLRCKDVWISELIELTDGFGWSVKIKSIQEELWFFIWVGSFIICRNPLQDVNESNFVPSVVLMSSNHQEEELTLKSPVTKVKYGFRLFISRSIFSKFKKNWLIHN